MREWQWHALGRPLVGPFPKLSENRCFYGFSRFRRAHRACHCGCHGGRGVPMGGGDGGPTGVPSAVVVQAFLGSKTRIFVHSCPETAQERLRNGWRNGWVAVPPAASASPRGVQRPWGVASALDQASREASRARGMVPERPFPATLSLKNCDKTSDWCMLKYGAC